jgi:hypothetical protein
MLSSRPARRIAAAAMLAVLAVLFARGASSPATDGAAAPAAAGVGGRQPGASRGAGGPVAATTLAARTPAGGACSVPGIGDIGGLLGFCSLGSSGLTGVLNNLCQPGVPQPESASSGVNALIRPPATAKPIATPYNQYGMAGQYWAATNLKCSDMTSLIGNDVAGMIFDFAKAMDRVTITVYQSAAGEGILGWLQNAADRLISGLGNAIYFPYLAAVVIIAAIWLAWQGLIRKRGTRTVEGTIWIVLACAAAIWLIGRPADFTGLGKGVSDGISTSLNTAFAHLPSPGQSSCLPVAAHDPQISPSSFSYTSGRTVVDQNANELWTVLVCKPWLDGEFGTTAFATGGAKRTPVNDYARQLLWAQAIAVNERANPTVINAKQATYVGIGQAIAQRNPGIYPLFQGKEWTTRLEVAFAALLAAVVAGVLVLLISVTLILLKLGFLLLLIVGPFFLLIGIHPGFGRVVAVRWFEMLIGVLLKQAAVALALSVLLYSYSLIMGTADAVLPWALKILMITLVTVAVFIYRKPFQHLFAAVGYGAIGSTDRAEADLSRAAATARANTLTAATLAVPGFGAYRAARWARRNPAQAAGLALGAATAAATGSLAAGATAGANGAGTAAGTEGGLAGGAGGGSYDGSGAGAQVGVGARARAYGAPAATSPGSHAPPLRLPAKPDIPASWRHSSATQSQVRGGGPANGSAPRAPAAAPPPAVPAPSRQAWGPGTGGPGGRTAASGGAGSGRPGRLGRSAAGLSRPGGAAGERGPARATGAPGAGGAARSARSSGDPPAGTARRERASARGRPAGPARADRGAQARPAPGFFDRRDDRDEGPPGPFWLRPMRRRK